MPEGTQNNNLANFVSDVLVGVGTRIYHNISKSLRIYSNPKLWKDNSSSTNNDVADSASKPNEDNKTNNSPNVKVWVDYMRNGVRFSILW